MKLKEKVKDNVIYELEKLLYEIEPSIVWLDLKENCTKKQMFEELHKLKKYIDNSFDILENEIENWDWKNEKRMDN